MSRQQFLRIRRATILPLFGTGMFLHAASALAVNTTWTNAGGDGLWATPANWTNGVPGPSDTVIFAQGSPPGVVDLGGAERAASRVRFFVPGLTLANGALRTSAVDGNSADPTFIDSDILMNSRLDLGVFGLSVGGSISGGGTLSVNGFTVLSNVNPYTGATRLSGRLELQNAGAIPGSSSISAPRTSVRADYGSAGQVNKFNDTAFYETGRASLTLANHSAVPVSESMGTVSLMKSAGQVEVTTDDPAAPMTFQSNIIRNGGATRTVLTDPQLGARFISPQPPAAGGAGQQRVLVPWMIGARPIAGPGPTTPSFITYDPGASGDPNDDLGYRPLELATEYASSIVPGAAGLNTRLTTNQVVSVDSTVNALALDGASVQLASSSVLSLAQGAMALSASGARGGSVDAIIGSGRLDAQGELVVTTMPTGADRFNIGVPVTAGRLTTSGAGSLALLRANMISNEVLINDGTLIAGAAGALGGPNQTVRLSGGALRFESASQNYGTLNLDMSYLTPSSPVVNAGFVFVGDGLTAAFARVSGTGQIIKLGGGRLRVADDSATVLGGTVFMQEGSVQIDGTYESLPFGGTTINIGISGYENTCLLGTGTVLGVVRTSVAPGVDAPGRLSVATFSGNTQPPTKLFIEIAGAAPATEYDQLVVLNAVSLTNVSLELDVLNGFDPALGQQFTIVDNQFAAPLATMFNGLPHGAVFHAEGSTFQISYMAGDGNDVVLTTVVPEPATATGLLISVACLAAFRRARRKDVWQVSKR